MVCAHNNPCRLLIYVKNAKIATYFRLLSAVFAYAVPNRDPVEFIVHKKLSILALAGVLLASCSSEIYLRDGVTDGDTFYLAQQALSDNDPALQSWVSYSLARSTCQLQIGGDNPARARSYECELTARRLLLETWLELQALEPANQDRYLDELAAIQENGYLDEYVAQHFANPNWQVPAGLDLAAYRRWQRQHLPRHRAETRIIGSWNYARNVTAF